MPFKAQTPQPASNNAKKPVKKGLFDDEDDAPVIPEKKVQKKPAAKKNMFDEDDTDDFNFKPKQKVVEKK